MKHKFSYLLSLLTISVSFGVSSISLAQDRAQVARVCINGLLYRHIYNDGTPNGSTRNDISDSLAGQACRGVNTLQQAQAKRVCINGLLYRHIYNDGTPNGSTRNEDTTANLAVRACNGVATVEAAEEQRVCVNGLLYRHIYNDGTPNGSARTDMAASTAIDSCSIAGPDNLNANRAFTIHNNTGQAITALYLSPTSSDSWGSNDIGSSLFDGNSVSYNLSGGCNWDLRVELSNGQSLEQSRIDTCLNSIYSVRLNNSRKEKIGQPQSEQRRTERQCVNTTLNQVWDDIHCEFNNGMFEWRTIYLD